MKQETITLKSKKEHILDPNILLEHRSSLSSIGLFDGKMGLIIYFLSIGIEESNSKNSKLAKDLTEELILELKLHQQPAGFGSGLAGIAWGFEYLSRRGFIESNTDELLFEIDDYIYKYICESPDLDLNLDNGLLGFGYYLLSRLQTKTTQTDCLGRDFLLMRLMTIVINRLYEKLEQNHLNFEEPARFDILWNLPLFLNLLVELKLMKFYDQKINILLQRLYFLLKTKIPRSLSNRLYLIMILEKAAKLQGLSHWTNHIEVLKKSMDVVALTYELSDKNITLRKGMAGIIILEFLVKGHLQYTGEILKRLLGSSFWKSVDKEDKKKPIFLSLMNGVLGPGLALLIGSDKLHFKNAV